MSAEHQLEKEIDSSVSLDDIPDLPEFKTLLSGSYHMVLDDGVVEKDFNDKKYYGIDMTVKEVLELSEKPAEGDKLPAPGDKQSLLFDRSHAIGMGAFKAFIAPIAKQFDCKTVGDVIENSKGIEIILIGKRSHNKEKDQYNFQPKKVALV